MLKKKKKTQYQKDRIKEKVIKALGIMCIVSFVVGVVLGLVLKVDVKSLEFVGLLCVMIGLPVAGIFFAYLLRLSIKTVDKSDKEKEEFQTFLEKPLKNRFVEIYGTVKENPHNKDDFYVLIEPQCRFFYNVSIFLVVINVGENYTSNDFDKFFNTIGEDIALVARSALFIIFQGNLENEFIQEQLNDDAILTPWMWIYRGFYDEKNKKFIMRKRSFAVKASSKKTRKHLDNIFQISKNK